MTTKNIKMTRNIFFCFDDRRPDDIDDNDNDDDIDDDDDDVDDNDDDDDNNNNNNDEDDEVEEDLLLQLGPHPVSALSVVPDVVSRPRSDPLRDRSILIRVNLDSEHLKNKFSRLRITGNAAGQLLAAFGD